MKLTRILTIGAFAAAAFAQTTGSITIGGSIPGVISITNDTNTALSATQTLGSLVAANSSALAMLDSAVNVRLRSNQQFKLNASATFTNPGAASTDDGGTPIAAGDIGFGITAKDVTRANVVSARGVDAITAKFDYTTTAMTALTVTNGKTPFNGTTHGTINELSTSTQIMTGNRVSKLGNIQSDDNFMVLTFNAGTLPQYFTPTTSFQAVVTLTPVVF